MRPEGGDEQTNERTYEWTNKSPPVFYRTLSPLGLLPKKVKHRNRKRKGKEKKKKTEKGKRERKGREDRQKMIKDRK